VLWLLPTSPDGTNWTARTSAADNQCFCAVANTGAGNRVMTIAPYGPLFTPVVPPVSGLVIGDAGTNEISGVITSGITPISLQPLDTGRIRTTTSTNGNQQLLGAAVLPVGANIMRVRARSRTGTPTVTLGNASGGAQIVASVALSTAWKQLTIVAGAEVATTTNLWAKSTSTDIVEWDISYDTL